MIAATMPRRPAVGTPPSAGWVTPRRLTSAQVQSLATWLATDDDSGVRDRVARTFATFRTICPKTATTVAPGTLQRAALKRVSDAAQALETAVIAVEVSILETRDALEPVWDEVFTALTRAKSEPTGLHLDAAHLREQLAELHALIRAGQQSQAGQVKTGRPHDGPRQLFAHLFADLYDRETAPAKIAREDHRQRLNFIRAAGALIGLRFTRNIGSLLAGRVPPPRKSLDATG